MAELLRSARSRTWANVLGMVTSIVIVGLAIWPGGPTASEEASRQLESAQTVWALHGIGGLIALAGLIIAQRWRWRTAGRVMVGAVGAALLAWLLVSGEITARTMLTLALPGILLVLSAIGLAPMPAPEET